MSKTDQTPAIRLRGVRQHNLKNFDLDLPLNQLIVVTGLSGSGKSSLAFDTLFAEGQRRYIETFSPYARQFFDRMDKPQVDRIEGIPPAIAIEQRNTVKSTRSTVGTMTEICDHLKLLWPHLSTLHCRQCGVPVTRESPQQIWDLLKSDPAEALITFNLPLSEKLSLAESLELTSKQGYQRLLINREIIRIDELNTASVAPQGFLTVVQDRIKLTGANRSRFIEACEQAYHFGAGKLAVHRLIPGDQKSGEVRLFSNRFHCATCNIEYREPSPALFSFNHPLGACPACRGFGRIISIDYNLALPDRSKTLAGGAIKPWQTGVSADCQTDMVRAAKKMGVPLNVPFEKLSREHQDWVIDGEPGYGSDGEHQWPRAWYGVKGYFRWLESKAYKMHVRVLLSRYRAYSSCPSCHGKRFQPESLLYTLPADPVTHRPGITLADFYQLPVDRALDLVRKIRESRATGPLDPIRLVLEEVCARLGYLAEVGLGYLTLDRPTRTLSGGETERVNLTTCLGTRLVNTLFVLDEPSVGLHARDTARLVHILERLRDTGNTVVVVEHEAAVMRAADQIVDLGPGHGEAGGEIVFQGSYADVLESEPSLTGQYLSGRKRFDPAPHRPVIHSPAPGQVATKTLRVVNARANNLKSLTVEIPLNRLVCLTGVSGSGKSTLIRDVLMPALLARIQNPGATAAPSGPGEDEKSEVDEIAGRAVCASIEGWESIGRAVLVDQSALGKTPRSNPAVYIGAFEHIRDFFAQSEVARQRGLNSSAFSFNSGQGQCERCRGAGFEKIEMQFLSDIFIRCPDCQGRRYRGHILEVRVSRPSTSVPGNLTAPNIADVLEATVDDAIDFLSAFEGIRAATRAVASLKLLQEVGLGYLRLGQPINTLSGGESQRLKLVAHLSESNDTGANPGTTALFLFDEPTTGLHFEDVRVLLKVFQRLVDAGHSLLIIEHNLDVIKAADWIIDLGPDAGEAGGEIVCQGRPEQVAGCEASHTGRFLKEALAGDGSSSKAMVLRDQPRPFARLPADDSMVIHGAREHNLHNLSLSIPRNEFVVVTGVSGSGKSTLAFDLVFAEGQRRFLDSMNTYARQFVEQMSRPDVDLITGIPPTVSIEQRTTRGGGKSTVATVTEIYHFLRLLFARIGTQHCPDCLVPVEAQTRDQLAVQLRAEMKKRGDLLLLAPMVKNRKGFHTDVAEWAAKHGYAEVRADGKIHSTSEPFRLDRFREHDVEIVTGVLARKSPKSGSRGSGPSFQQLVDETLKLGRGTLFALDNHRRVTIHSTERACPHCGRSFEPLDPKMFSYNSAQGWCPKCRGFGELFYLPEVERGANADAIEESWWSWQEGKREPCPECHGARLNSVARSVRLHTGSRLPAGIPVLTQMDSQAPNIDNFSALPVDAAFGFFSKVKFSGRQAAVARDILPEIRERLSFLNEVGLGYLQLGRGVTTLSGGEAQRIRLAAQLGSNLSGVLYVLDEPTIGLHARDNEQLLAALDQLQRRGNSLLVVEHDEETMRRATHIIDLGPGAGVHGGRVVASGTLAELAKHPESITGQFLRAEKSFPARGKRRPVVMEGSTRKTKAKTEPQVPTPCLTLHHAIAHNLNDLSVAFPLARLVLVTGVSGSGKSTLIRECLLPALQQALPGPRKSSPAEPAASTAGTHVSGHQRIKAVYEVDQSPIGRTPRSTPATYVGFFDDIRALFAQTPEARMRGWTGSRFSFNSAQGRCPGCEGAGVVKLEMNFLPPAFVRCETCLGLRFSQETLAVEYRNKNIAQILDLSVEEAVEFFATINKIRRPLEALRDTGLGYLKLGQTSPTLSGGEAQRLKLVTHLLTGLKEQLDPFAPLDPKQRRNLFILEEPTIGLHMSDVRKLVGVLQRLVDAGHTVIVIEHNLDLIAEADWVIDLGPEAGASGGNLVVQGTPEQVAANKRSHTGQFLHKLLKSS